MNNSLFFDRFKKVKVFAFDIDGVLTNGQLLITEEGHFLRSMNIKDGYALQLAVKKGYEIVIISGGNSTAVKKRLERLGISNVFIQVDKKDDFLMQLAKINHWTLDEILYMGDDMPDLEIMKICGFKTCPKDAVMEIKELSDYISSYPGGMGCVRDVIEKVLKLQGKWE